jgi:hypothetical protein
LTWRYSFSPRAQNLATPWEAAVSRLIRSALALAVIFGAGAALADSKPAAPSKDEIAKWIKQLGDADFDVRQKASEQIWNATDDETTSIIEAALREALKSDDTEIVRRASELLDRLQTGINAKTPKKVVDLLERFRAAEPGARKEIIKELLTKHCSN